MRLSCKVVEPDKCEFELHSKSTNVIIVRNIRKAIKRNLKRIILGHLTINLIRNKFDLTIDQIKDNIDIMVIPESKLDESFPSASLKIQYIPCLFS